jgi:hypothetical protein
MLVFVVMSLICGALFALRPQTPHAMLGFTRAINDGGLLANVIRDPRRASEIAAEWRNSTDMEVVYLQSDAPPSMIDLSRLESEQLRWLSDNILPGTIPAVSPDGALIAASLALPASDIPAAQSESIPALYLIDLATSESQLLWVGVAGALSWSPAGDYLAFELVSRVRNDRSIWLYERASGEVYTVTAPGIQEISPAWVRYRGRPFEGALLLGLDTTLLVLLAFTQKKEQSHSTTPVSSSKAES